MILVDEMTKTKSTKILLAYQNTDLKQLDLSC